MDFALKYAIKEIKRRPMEFLPIFLTSFGVLVLIFNLIIFLESQRVTNLSYYRLDYEIKLYDMPPDSIEHIESLSYVKNVRNLKSGNTKGLFTLYIGFQSPHGEASYGIYRAFDKLIEDIDLWQYPYYQNNESIQKTYRTDGFNSRTLRTRFSSWFNVSYINALDSQPVISPAMNMIYIAGALVMAAVMILVFNLKLKKNMSEYAMLRSLGMTAFDIMKINMFQGIGIMSVCAPFTFAVSAAVMKLVCEASHNIYPEIKDNSQLMYVLPVGYILIAVTSILIVSSAALLLVCRGYNKKILIELMRGMDSIEVSYLEKSSDRFEKAKDFSYYGKLYDKRTRGLNRTTNVLYVSMMIFPLIFSFFVFSIIDDIIVKYLNSDDVRIYRLSINNSQISDFVIPKSMVDEILEIEGVTRAERRPENGDSYYRIAESMYSFANQYITDKDNNRHDVTIYEYGGDELDKRHDYLGNWQGGTITLDDVTSDMVLQGNLDDLKIPGTAAVFQAVGAAVGDEVTLQYGEYELNAVIAAVLADNKHLVTPYGYFDEDTGKNVIGTRSYVFCSADTLSSLFGFEEALYTSWLTIYAKKGYEKEAVRRIEDIADIDMSEDEYASIHEQWEFAVGLIGSNIYLTDKKYAAIEIFLCLFLAAQIAFLFISAALIISSINNFNINKRRGEFAIIRALGEQRSNIVNAIKRASFINAVFVAAASIIASLSFLIFMSFTGLMQSSGSLDDWFKMLARDLPRIYLAYIFMFAFMICVNLISSLKSAKKATGDNLINDIRKY